MLELFLRIRVIFISIFFMAIFTGFLVFPDRIIELAEQLENQESSIRSITSASAVLADVLLLFIIYQEIRPRTRTGEGLLVKSNRASAEVTLESVKSTVEAQIVKLEDIFDAYANVGAFRGRVTIEMSIDAKNKTNVRKKTGQIQREIVKIVEKQMGLKLAEKPVIVFRLLTEPAAPPTYPYSIPNILAPTPEAAPAPKPPVEEKKKGRFNLFSRGQEKNTPAATPSSAPKPPAATAPPVTGTLDDEDDEFTFLVSPDKQ